MKLVICLIVADQRPDVCLISGLHVPCSVHFSSLRDCSNILHKLHKQRLSLKINMATGRHEWLTKDILSQLNVITTNLKEKDGKINNKTTLSEFKKCFLNIVQSFLFLISKKVTCLLEMFLRRPFPFTTLFILYTHIYVYIYISVSRHIEGRIVASSPSTFLNDLHIALINVRRACLLQNLPAFLSQAETEGHVPTLASRLHIMAPPPATIS
jgi:hypothetical protein